MATVYRKCYTMPVPKHAELVEQKGKMFAKWKDTNGKRHLDVITIGRRGQYKILRYTPTFWAQYRDADGQMIYESTGCRDETAAKHVLAEMLKRVEHIKAGILTNPQCRMADHSKTLLQVHVDAYIEHLRGKTVRGKRVCKMHCDNVKRQLGVLLMSCNLKRLQDITREAMERWMNRAERAGLGPRTRNIYRAAIVAFCNWCVETDRLTANPLARLCSADEHADRRRIRRALTADELSRLFTAARLRPLAEYGRVVVSLPQDQKKGRSTWQKEPLCIENLESNAQKARAVLKNNPELLDQLEWTGRERELIYKTLALTGLRKSELASITIGQLWLDEKQPYLELKAKDEKNGRGASIPLRSDLAAAIRQFVSEKRRRLSKNALPRQKSTLMANVKLFTMIRSIGIFNRDLAAAGIPKKDERGRSLDIHALRHTFGTHLSLAGVPPRVAQAAMRHSSLDLTMNIYTDPTLLDVAGAVNALPSFGCQTTAPAKAGA